MEKVAARAMEKDEWGIDGDIHLDKWDIVRTPEGGLGFVKEVVMEFDGDVAYAWVCTETKPTITMSLHKQADLKYISTMPFNARRVTSNSWSYFRGDVKVGEVSWYVYAQSFVAHTENGKKSPGFALLARAEEWLEKV